MMQSFIHLFANHKVAPNLLMLLLFISGAYGLKQLNTQFFPDYAVNTVIVGIVWPGAAAVCRSVPQCAAGDVVGGRCAFGTGVYLCVFRNVQQ